MWLISKIRKLGAIARDRLDGWLHPRRRAAAQSRLRRIHPDSVLFVCLGNICRSPFGERLLAERSTRPLTIGSVGFIGPGRPPPEEALAAASAIGIDHSDHRSATLAAERLAHTDVLFFFDRHNRKMLSSVPGARMDRTFWLGDFDPQWSGRRAIIDPWGRGDEAFRETFARIERCVNALVTELDGAPAGSSPQAPDPVDGLADER